MEREEEKEERVLHINVNSVVLLQCYPLCWWVHLPCLCWVNFLENNEIQKKVKKINFRRLILNSLSKGKINKKRHQKDGFWYEKSVCVIFVGVERKKWRKKSFWKLFTNGKYMLLK